MTHPTDALRLEAAKIIDPAAFLFQAEELMKGDTSQYDALRKAERILALAAPASPLPEGGGQCSGITGELDPRLVEWGYTSLDEAITHLGKLLDDQTAFDGLGDLIAELKEAHDMARDMAIFRPGESTPDAATRMRSSARAFLARNGKGEG